MPLDPQAQKLVDAAVAAGLPPVHTLPVAEARQRMARALTWTGEREPVARVQELELGGAIKARLYRPGAAPVLPVVLFFHGGGWVLNDLETHDHLCRALANLSGCAVLAVDYRRAPEHKFPAANDDAWAALQWLVRHAADHGLDATRVAVAGDSSGATLATTLALRVRDDGGPVLMAQVLFYPVTDHWSAGSVSYDRHGSGYSLTRDLMIWFWRHYLADGTKLDDAQLCPLRARDLRGMPPAMVITAEFDPLCSEGEAYAARLAAAGVETIHRCQAGMMHGFAVQFRVLDKGRESLGDAARFLRDRLKPAGGKGAGA